MQFLGDPVQAGSVGKCGGGGGTAKTLSCPSGQYVIALYVRTGAYVDRIGIKCAAFDSSVVRGPAGAFKYGGGGSGHFSETRTCSGNRAYTYIETKAGGYIDKIEHIVCTKRKAAGGFGGDTERLKFTRGGIGGLYCTLECGAGEAIHKVVLRSGAWMDSIEAFCKP
jgi:hypothetical protein